MMNWEDDARLARRKNRVYSAERLDGKRVAWAFLTWIITAAALMTWVSNANAQTTRVRDLTVRGGDIPVRLVGYGLVSGLDGSGDRVSGSTTAGHTVRSIANLLRRFNVEVPENVLRTRNVAAVLVTAEVSAYLRPGGRFDVHVSSIGDATSLRGGVLWITPLQAGPSEPLVATAQGALLVSEGSDPRGGYPIETTVSLPSGGLLEQPFVTPDFATAQVLYLREPDLQTAIRIADVINSTIGPDAANVDDPGSVTLTLDAAGDNPAIQLAQIGELSVIRARRAQVIIDGRAGTVIAGGGLQVGEAVVSHGAMTLAIGGLPATDSIFIPGDLRVGVGATVQDIAGALHGVAAPPESIAAVFEALRQIGALTAEVTIR